MPPTSASSFIPKRNPINRPKSVRRYNLVIIPVISYTLFMSSLIAAGVLFIYQIRVDSQLNAAVQNLKDQIGNFNDADLNRVIDFDQRLELANKMVTSHVSLVSLLSILETVTAETIQFKNLNIVRKDDHTLGVTAALVTSSLDGALFQRATYDASSLITATKLAGITLVPAGTAADGKTATKGSVMLNADFVFSTDKILYKPLTIGNGTSAGVETSNPAPAATAPTVSPTPVAPNTPSL